MAIRILRGCVEEGMGDARNWAIEAIRKATGRNDLEAGTLNIRLEEPYCMRQECMLQAADNNRPEDIYFQSCCLLIGEEKVRVEALIARTSHNHYGCGVIEIMASINVKASYGVRTETPSR